jgi:hypothetical protein
MVKRHHIYRCTIVLTFIDYQTSDGYETMDATQSFRPRTTCPHTLLATLRYRYIYCCSRAYEDVIDEIADRSLVHLNSLRCFVNNSSSRYFCHLIVFFVLLVIH